MKVNAFLLKSTVVAALGGLDVEVLAREIPIDRQGFLPPAPAKLDEGAKVVGGREVDPQGEGPVDAGGAGRRLEPGALVRREEPQAEAHEPVLPPAGHLLRLDLVVHVVLARGLQDDEFIAAHTLGFDQLRSRVGEYPPERVSQITGIPVEMIVTLGERYGRAKAAFLRVNYGLQRHGGAAMAVRTIACLPALTGHWRRPGGGVQLSSSANFEFNKQALFRLDLSPPVRTINMIRLGEALTKADAGIGGPPVRAIVVYNSNPAAVAPDRNEVLEGFRREDLFTVVLEHFQTDTADYADFVLPATTQLEHFDIHGSYGHLYVQTNEPAIAPLAPRCRFPPRPL